MPQRQIKHLPASTAGNRSNTRLLPGRQIKHLPKNLEALKKEEQPWHPSQ
jgi:hypothetical protein